MSDVATLSRVLEITGCLCTWYSVCVDVAIASNQLEDGIVTSPVLWFWSCVEEVDGYQERIVTQLCLDINLIVIRQPSLDIMPRLRDIDAPIRHWVTKVVGHTHRVLCGRDIVRVLLARHS
jgi:hypothetical protein